MRKHNFKQPFRELQLAVKGISNDAALSMVDKFNQIISLIADFLNRVRVQLLAVPFDEDLEEVYFFKFEKPEYAALRLYYAFLFGLMSRKPVGARATLRKFYLRELAFLRKTLKRYYSYFRSGATDLDEHLFLRGSVMTAPVLMELPELDPEFATPGEYLFSMFMAYERLQEHILEELALLEKNPVVLAAPAASGLPKRYFEYTGELINMVELAYGLWVSGQFNNGKASLVEIFRWLEETLGIELGVPSNRFREIKRRKRLSRTHFMELCMRELLAYMDQENALERKRGESNPGDEPEH